MTDGRATAYSEREREFTFAKKRFGEMKDANNVKASVRASQHQSNGLMANTPASTSSCKTTLLITWRLHALTNKDQLSLTNPRNMLHHGERAANK